MRTFIFLKQPKTPNEHRELSTVAHIPKGYAPAITKSLICRTLGGGQRDVHDKPVLLVGAAEQLGHRSSEQTVFP
jgi:hypothetical protein